MVNTLNTLVSHATTYFIDNISCLTYGVEVLIHKSLIFSAYYDLLVDLSESYGIWIALTTLVLATLASMVAVHQVLSASADFVKSSFNSTKTGSSLNFTNYSLLTKFKTSLSSLLRLK